MKKSLAVLLSSIMILSSACVPASALSTGKKDNKKINYVEGEAIVVLRDNADSNYTKASKASVLYGNGVKLKESYSFRKKSGNLCVAVLKSATLTTKEIISGLKKNSKIKYAFPNYKKKASAITEDTYSKFQWPLENTGQNNGKAGVDIKADELWDKAGKAQDENVVAVLDTGIDIKNDEFKDVLWKNPYGNKLLGSCGIDLTGTYSDFKPNDDHGHGSHVAGVIAAKSGNQTGISGVNKSNVKIMAVKILNSMGGGTDAGILAGFEYVQRAIELGTKVTAINCSFGGEGDETERAAYDEVINALGEKGVITCIASGNEELNLNDLDDPESDNYFYGEVVVPACSKSPYAITVTGANENGDIPSYANVGDHYVDVAAPGTNILSTVSYNCFNPSIYDSSEIEKLCSHYQNYDGDIKSTDFGYPKNLTGLKEISPWENLKVESSDSYFGNSGKSAKITPEGKKASKTVTCAFEVPFTLDDADKNYSVSLMMKADGNAEGYCMDIPADSDIDEAIEDSESYFDILAYGDNDWTHIYSDVDVKKDIYDKDKDRKLVFVFHTDGAVYIDDLAVSNQSADEDDFGKYDFYSGTSMATSFVTASVALARNAYPEVSTLELVNMVSNSGEAHPEYEGKVKHNNFLTLDSLENIPPMISKASYNDDGNVKIEGSFKNVEKAYVNDKEVNILSQDDVSVEIPDNKYSTYNVKIKLENSAGSDSIDVLLSKKKAFPETEKVLGKPEDTSTALFVPAGYKSYFIDTYYGTVGELNTTSAKKSYTYEGERYDLGLNKLFESELYLVNSAVYFDNKIYLTISNNIVSSSKMYTLGYDSILACFDPKTEKTVKVCDLPDECLLGSSLAVYNNSLYLIGGYEINDLELVDSVYKLNASKKEFAKTDTPMPEGRAYTQFIEFGGKLVGFYGSVESTEMPPAIIFDGKSWKTSSVKLESSDCDTYTYSDDKTVKQYIGNVGVDKNGVFCNGAYVSGYGDTFTYDVANDKIIESPYCARFNTTDTRLIGTTVPGAFIGFTVVDMDSDYDDDDDDYYDSYSLDTNSISNPDFDAYGGVKTYMIELDNTSRYSAPPKTPKLSATSASLKSGASKSLKVTNGKVVSWSSSKKSVAVVKNGKVTALKKGSAGITATLSDGSKLTCNVKVTTSPTIKVGGKKYSSKTTYSVKKSGNLKVKITGKAASMNNVYKTSNKKVAKVTSAKSAKTVKIKGIKKGSANITVKVNGVSFKIKVKVK